VLGFDRLKLDGDFFTRNDADAFSLPKPLNAVLLPPVDPIPSERTHCTAHHPEMPTLAGSALRAHGFTLESMGLVGRHARALKAKNQSRWKKQIVGDLPGLPVLTFLQLKALIRRSWREKQWQTWVRMWR
jgi:hypothetical protein